MECLSTAALQEHTNKDEILQVLSVHILHNRKPEATGNCATYSKVFDELTTVHSLYLDYSLSQTSLYFELKAWSLGHLSTLSAIFISLSRTSLS